MYAGSWCVHARVFKLRTELLMVTLGWACCNGLAPLDDFPLFGRKDFAEFPAVAAAECTAARGCDDDAVARDLLEQLRIPEDGNASTASTVVVRDLCTQARPCK